MDLYDYLYKDRTLDFLRHEFNSGKGFAGHGNVTVAVIDGEVVAPVFSMIGMDIHNC